MELDDELSKEWSFKDRQECRDRTNQYWTMQEHIVKNLRAYLKSLKIEEK